jgi:hypothetical protein
MCGIVDKLAQAQGDWRASIISTAVVAIRSRGLRAHGSRPGAGRGTQVHRPAPEAELSRDTFLAEQLKGAASTPQVAQS